MVIQNSIIVIWLILCRMGNPVEWTFIHDTLYNHPHSHMHSIKGDRLVATLYLLHNKYPLFWLKATLNQNTIIITQVHIDISNAKPFKDILKLSIHVQKSTIGSYHEIN